LLAVVPGVRSNLETGNHHKEAIFGRSGENGDIQSLNVEMPQAVEFVPSELEDAASVAELGSIPVQS
jgi:hypothetical protein